MPASKPLGAFSTATNAATHAHSTAVDVSHEFSGALGSVAAGASQAAEVGSGSIFFEQPTARIAAAAPDVQVLQHAAGSIYGEPSPARAHGGSNVYSHEFRFRLQNTATGQFLATGNDAVIDAAAGTLSFRDAFIAGRSEADVVVLRPAVGVWAHVWWVIDYGAGTQTVYVQEDGGPLTTYNGTVTAGGGSSSTVAYFGESLISFELSFSRYYTRAPSPAEVNQQVVEPWASVGAVLGGGNPAQAMPAASGQASTLGTAVVPSFATPTADYDALIAALSPTYRWQFDGTTTEDIASHATATGGSITYAAGINPAYPARQSLDIAAGSIVRPTNSPNINTGGGYSFGARTIAFWFQADSLIGKRHLYEQGGGTRSIQFYHEATTLYMTLGNASSVDSFVSTAIAPGEAYWVVGVWDLNTPTLVLYLNGVPVGSATPTISSLSPHSGDVQIGSTSDARDISGSNGGYSTFDGRIQDLVYWTNVVVGPTDIAAVYASTQPASGDLDMDPAGGQAQAIGAAGLPSFGMPPAIGSTAAVGAAGSPSLALAPSEGVVITSGAAPLPSLALPAPVATGSTATVGAAGSPTLALGMPSATGSAAIVGASEGPRLAFGMPSANGSAATIGAAEGPRLAIGMPSATGSTATVGAAEAPKVVAAGTAGGVVTTAGAAEGPRLALGMPSATGSAAAAGAAEGPRLALGMPSATGSAAAVGAAEGPRLAIGMPSATGSAAIVGAAGSPTIGQRPMAFGLALTVGAAAAPSLRLAMPSATGSAAAVGAAEGPRLAIGMPSATGSAAIVGAAGVPAAGMPAAGGQSDNEGAAGGPLVVLPAAGLALTSGRAAFPDLFDPFADFDPFEETVEDRRELIENLGAIVTISGAPVWALLDRPTEGEVMGAPPGSAPFGGYMVENQKVELWVIDENTPARGATVIADGISYTVAAIKPDGTGVTVCLLEEVLE